MIFDAFDHSFSTDQQKKIMKQIQSINKRLTTNSQGIKLFIKNKQTTKRNLEQQYFSEQCQQLFQDQNHNFNHNKPVFDDSLFSSKNDMLLDNQYQKQVVNFKQFQTDKFLTQCNNDNNIPMKKNAEIIKIFESQKSKGDSLFKKKNVSSKQDEQNIKNQLMTGKVPPQNKNKNQSNIKSIAQSKIKRYIENKQNYLPASNVQNVQKQNVQRQKERERGKYFIKQAKKKIRFQTLPDYCPNKQDEDSLQLFNKVDQNKKPMGFYQNYSKADSRSKNKYDTHKRSLDCTFKPSILKKSNQIAQNLQPSFERLTQDIGTSKSQSKLPYKNKQQLSTKKYSVKRLDQLSQPRKLKTTIQPQQQKYVFRPSLSKKSLQQMANCTLDVAQRNKLWLQQKEAKINRIKIQQQERKLKKQMGSYAPKIIQYKGQSQVHLSRFAKQGMSNYFERVSMAKQRNSTFQKRKNQQKEASKQNPVIMKKKTYDEAVKQLHNKILTMNI